jgi:hypothetical protein
MTTLAYSGSATGTGSVTLVTPATNTNQTLTLPDNSGTLVSTASTGVVTPAMLNGAQTGSAPIYGCRAWVNFDGTLTGTNAPRAGGNVTSVQRLSAGSYLITFTTALPDALFCVTATAGDTSGASCATMAPSVTQTASTVRVDVLNSAGASADRTSVSVTIFR